MEACQRLGHVQETAARCRRGAGVLALAQEQGEGLGHDVGRLWFAVRHRRVGEDVRPDWGDEHVLRPARLQNRLLDPLHVHVQTPLLEWTGECVRGQRLEPGEQGEVAVVELALAQDVGELDRVRVLARRRLLLAVVDTALVEDALDDQLEEPVVGRHQAGTKSAPVWRSETSPDLLSITKHRRETNIEQPLSGSGWSGQVITD